MIKKLKGKKPSFYIINSIFILLMMLVIYVVIKIIIGIATSTPTCIFSHYVFLVQTDSMNPVIKAYDLIFVKKVAITSINEGDIISFICIDDSLSIKGQAIVHRVIEVINNDGDPAFVTKGDANAIKDTLVVDQTNFLGKVTGISSFLGKIAKFLTSTSSFFFFLVIVICVYVIFTQIRKILKIRKEQIHEAEVNKIKNEIVNQEKGVEYEKNHHHHCDHS